MSLVGPVAVLIATTIISWYLTGIFRRVALARALLDIPNARSSHTVAVPRGGGVAIVISALVGLLIVRSIGLVAAPLFWGIVGGGVLVSVIGFVDDAGHVAARWRLLAHMISALWIISWIGGLAPVQIGGRIMEPGVLADALVAIYIVWILNLTNFMDGIDGIAAIESITVCACAAAIYSLSGLDARVLIPPMVIAAASLGFLFWNWPPARIFMGDAGSGFIGLVLAALSLAAGQITPALFWSWVILLGVFIVDSTVTLVRRVFRGQKFYEAHRSHAYQHAALRFGSHLSVTLAVAGINIVWLFPIALVVAKGSINPLTGTLIAYAPLVGIVIWLKAGQLSQPELTSRPREG